MKTITLFDNNIWVIRKYINPDTNKYSLIIYREFHHTDYPIQYENGKIAYDNPHLIPKYIKDKVEKLIGELN